MITKIKNWLQIRAITHDAREKGRLCAPCATFCGDELCQKIGCLNMDMRTNSIRLRSLVKRLEDRGYEFPTEDKIPHNVVNLDDFRK